jgi:DNA-binding IclR family transcriptional regulator
MLRIFAYRLSRRQNANMRDPINEVRAPRVGCPAWQGSETRCRVWAIPAQCPMLHPVGHLANRRVLLRHRFPHRRTKIDWKTRPPGRVPGDGPVTKSLTLLDAFAEAEQPLRFSDLKGRLPFPKATLHRMLKSLVDERMLTHNETTGSYQLGPRLIRLAHAAWAHGSLSDAARPILDKLHAELGKTIHLAQLDNGQVLYLDKRVGNRGLAMFSRPGKVGPAYCTGVGKAMMAYLPDDALEDCLHRQTLARFTATTLTTALRAARRTGSHSPARPWL